MSMMLTKLICSTMMSLAGIKIVKDISDAKLNNLSVKSLLSLFLLISIPAIIYSTEYSYVYSILIYGLTAITYKEILGISFIKSIISCGIMLISLILLDFVVGTLLSIFLTANEIRNTWYFNIISNMAFILTMNVIFSREDVKRILPKFIDKIENKKVIRIIVAIILSLITMSVILNIMTKNLTINMTFITSIILFIVFLILVLLLLGERNNYENLSDEYENLFKYVQIFEDWIENEQLTRHEYKNQLAILRSLTKEKQVKNKIDSIVSDFINIDNNVIAQLKNVPNGGLKGLLYYKISLARKKKLNLIIDIDDIAGKELSKISDEKQKILTKLLGIYLDNAMEASLETQKKIVTIEIYKIKEDIKVVISNTFNNKEDISRRNKKGVSTKGTGRGNGLYFASKLIFNNKWIKGTQNIQNNFYIQDLIIKKQV